MPYKFAYLAGVLLILFPLWLFFFIRRKGLRREMLFVSTIIGLLSPLSELLYFRDYWYPETIGIFGLEDFLYGFMISGIAASVYEELWGKHLVRVRGRQRLSFIFLFAVLFLLIVLPLVFVAGLNSIYATIIGILAIALVIVLMRRDLIADSLISGLLTGTVMFVGYTIFLLFFPEAITRWWFLQNISGVLVWGIPIEELIWGFAVGAAIGPIYEFLLGYRLKSGTTRLIKEE